MNTLPSIYLVYFIRPLNFGFGFPECFFCLRPHIIAKEELTYGFRVWEGVLRGQWSLVILPNFFYLLILCVAGAWAWRNWICQDLRRGDTG
jgi:hypothetical protein